MNINDIDNIIKSPKNENLYNLTQRTFKYPNNVVFEEYTIQSGEEMRIDLICQSIYGNTNYIDLILNVNNIDNPLNVKEGVTIRYPRIQDIRLFSYDDKSQKDSSRNIADQISLTTRDKSTRRDENRKKYVKDKYSLPPTTLNTPIEQVQVTDNKVVIGTGLFNK